MVAYSVNGLQSLEEAYMSIDRECDQIVTRSVSHPYQTQTATEHGRQGLGRRLNTLKVCIRMIFNALPPKETMIPEKDNIEIATISLQSFVLNTFGCLDNLAWIWVNEKGVRGVNGGVLKNVDIGFGKKYKIIMQSLTDKISIYMHDRNEWFNHIRSFRDALAHRIPLYIPHYFVSPDNVDEYSRLSEVALECLNRHDVAGYDECMKRQISICYFSPIMAHSLYEDDMRPIFFHAQVISDFRTVVEFSNLIFDELVAAAKMPL